MTPKTRSLINNKGPIDIEPYKSKFFTSVYSSEESSIEGLKQKSINETTTEDESEEELKISSRGLVQIVGSLDISLLDTDAPLLFNNQVDESEVTLDPPSNSLQVTTRKYDDPLENKRRQGRLLLVSLLENFCLLYDTNPERNHELFYLICKNLSAMGIIEEEHIDEMSTVRSSYQRAFKALVIQALNSIKQERLMKESRLLMHSCPGSDFDKPDKPSSSNNKIPHSAKTKKDNSNSKVLKNLSFGDILDLENSRYSNDFVELKLLGKGGFASVWKAKNKLDGRKYAIKKIRLRGDKIPEEKEKIFREIKILARLEHTNVVRYYSSWLEHISRKQRSNEDETSLLLNSEENSSHFASSNGYHSDNESSINSNQDNPDIFRMSFSDDDGIDFVDDISAAGKLNSSSSINSGFNNDTSTYTANTNYICNKKNNRFSQNHVTIKADKISHSHIPKDVGFLNLEKDWVLFIQMQLCNSTLRDYLKNRDANILATTTDRLSSIDHNTIIDLFRGIVRGVAYIHDQGLIHRDLKPGNIFIGGLADSGQDNLVVANNLLSFSNERVVPKIGDFGLVTAVDGDHTYSTIDNSINRELKGSVESDHGLKINNKSNNNNNNSQPKSSYSSSYTSKSRTTGVGTITYASPEQLARPPQPYNEKVDIYSLGIIFFELHFSFSTGHERAQVIKNLRNEILPKGFVKRFPKEAAFILWMMAEDPDKRPSAKQILDFELLSDSNQEEHSKIQLRLVESTHKLELVTQENEILKKKVAELEEKLKKYENLITYNTKETS